jgi:hypothetical protein
MTSNYITKYKLGGLEKLDNDESVIDIDSIKYVIDDKFRSMLRNTLIDWESFLEVYHDSMDDNTMFNHIIRLLNLKDTKNIKDMMLPLVKTVYNMPIESHMAAMTKQFMLYEPVSYAIHSVFSTIKRHYENIVEKYVIARNRYILLNKTTDKENDWVELVKYWADLNDEYELDSSSIILLFLNPPKGLNSKLHIELKSVPETITLKAGLKKFHYPGFCPKVPKERLDKLLTFPLDLFVSAIKKLDPDAKFPDYKNLEKLVSDILKKKPSKPDLTDNIPRESPPDIKDKIELIKWYVDKIFELRKKITSYGKKYEEYYTQHAILLNEINLAIKEELKHLH